MKVLGRWRYLYRAVDQLGQVIDVLLSPKRDQTAARRFFTRALAGAPAPAEVTTDRAAAYPHVLDELAPAAPHVTVDNAHRTYQRTASVITSGGKRNPANSERAAPACRVDLTNPGCPTARPIVLSSHATAPAGVVRLDTRRQCRKGVERAVPLPL